MGRWGACHKCGYEVRLAYVRIQNELTPIGLWCRRCGLEDEKIVIVHKSGYVNVEYYKLKFKDGRVIREELGAMGLEV